MTFFYKADGSQIVHSFPKVMLSLKPFFFNLLFILQQDHDKNITQYGNSFSTKAWRQHGIKDFPFHPSINKVKCLVWFLNDLIEQQRKFNDFRVSVLRNPFLLPTYTDSYFLSHNQLNLHLYNIFHIPFRL